MLHMNETELETYNEVAATYNEQVAEMFISAVNKITGGEKVVQILDTVAASMLVTKAIVGTYLEKGYPNLEEAPVDLRNMMYYLEQNMASLAVRYKEKKEASPIVLL